MKLLALSLAMLCPFLIKAQSIEKNKQGDFELTIIKEKQGKSVDEIYLMLSGWISDHYADKNSEIIVNDKSIGRIVATGQVKVKHLLRTAIIEHKVSIEIRKGRFRMVFSDFIYDDNDSYLPFERPITGKKKLILKTNAEINKIIEAIDSKEDSTDW